MTAPLKVLGIETSCDETAVAVVTSDRRILSHKIYSQIQEHQGYGGVIPEFSARAHIHKLPSMVDQVLREVPLSEIDAFAATIGPGLIGSLHVGVSYAKGLALAQRKPFIAVNHLEAHALTARLTNNIAFPYLLLLVSGGHCQLIAVRDFQDYALLGQTRDDSAGEVFDKIARMMNIGYPGGPIIEQIAQNGNPLAFNFPQSFRNASHCDFSFSGLKTAVRMMYAANPNPTASFKADIAASLQHTIAQVFVNRLQRAYPLYQRLCPGAVPQLVVAGGVAANLYIRSILETFALNAPCIFVAPFVPLCTDNGAMVAWVAIERMLFGDVNDKRVMPKPRLSIDYNIMSKEETA